MKIKNVLIAPIGVITFPAREREDQLLLSVLEYVGHHQLCNCDGILRKLPARI